MDSCSVVDAEARFYELIERVEAGESIAIIKHGKHVATLTPTKDALEPFDFGELRRTTDDAAPVQKEGAGEFMRRLRDQARY